MASIRRTLSPVPRPGILLSGEACSVASPLSKTSIPDNSSLGGSYSSPFVLIDCAFSRVVALLPGFFLQRPSRAPERAKLKGQVWRRALFHFFACFLIGLFVGLTPFFSIKLSTTPILKNQAFSFDHVGTVQLHNEIPANSTAFEDDLLTRNNDTVEPLVTSSVPPTSVQKFNAALETLLIVVTPVSSQPVQAFFLNRLAQTLKLVRPPLLWIVVEMNGQSSELAEVLRRTGVMYRHLVCTENMTQIKDSMDHQRNAALLHIETHRLDGIVYFADDYNFYSLELFEQMRLIRRFGTWPIAKLLETSQLTLMGPVCNGTRVVGWHTNDVIRSFRRFHADLSGFAFNSTVLWDKKGWHRPTLEPIRQRDSVTEGFQVSAFIEQVVEDESEMEGVPENCSKILVWEFHRNSFFSFPINWFRKDNLDILLGSKL